MPIEYRELTPDDDFAQCVQLQREVFGFSDVDVISPLVLKMIARDTPPMGVLVGAFNVIGKDSRLIGLMVGMGTFLDGAVYLPLGGVLPEFQAGTVAAKMARCFREACLKKGLVSMYALHEPLEPHLARLYYGGFGYVGVQYLPDDTGVELPHDRLLARWDLSAPRTVEKLAGLRQVDFLETVRDVPRAEQGQYPSTSRVLVEIPADFRLVAQERADVAQKLRMSARAVFHEYINCRGYAIVDCITGKLESGRVSYYILEAVER